VDTEYPTSRWNVYPFHFSDGEDWDPSRTSAAARKLMEQGVQMLGYGEVHVNDYGYDWTNLLPEFKKAFPLTEYSREGLTVVSSTDVKLPFVGVVIKDKKHIYPAVQEFLKKERWSKK
jgi:uncharacterized protein